MKRNEKVQNAVTVKWLLKLGEIPKKPASSQCCCTFPESVKLQTIPLYHRWLVSLSLVVSSNSVQPAYKHSTFPVIAVLFSWPSHALWLAFLKVIPASDLVLSSAGMNSIFVYTGQNILGFYLPFKWEPAKLSHGELLLQSLLNIILWVYIAYLLYRKRIFIKL